MILTIRTSRVHAILYRCRQKKKGLPKSLASELRGELPGKESPSKTNLVTKALSRSSLSIRMTSKSQLRQRHPWNCGRGQTWIRLAFACAAVFAVVAARSVPPHFPDAFGSHSSFSIDSHHDQRPRFDDSGSKWVGPAEISLLFPAGVESVHPMASSRPFARFYIKGVHYNRPPPLG